MKDKFYIYVHINLVTNEIFYVGKGCGNRLNKTTKRSSFWNNIVNKYGYDALKIEENLSDNDAYELEKYYINKIGRRDLGLGPLVNLTDGGEGGINVGEVTRNKHSINNSGSGNPFYGKTHTEETKNKIKLARALQVFSEETRAKITGKKISAETKLKMSLAHKGRKMSQESIAKMLETRKINKNKQK